MEEKQKIKYVRSVDSATFSPTINEKVNSPYGWFAGPVVADSSKMTPEEWQKALEKYL